MNKILIANITILLLILVIALIIFLPKKQIQETQDLETEQNNEIIIPNLMKITSSAFSNRQKIPTKYTCGGENINPPLKIEQVPQEAKSLVLIMYDPDSPVGVWDHWIVFNINPNIEGIAEHSVPPNSIQGKNSWGSSEYGGPCPPTGTHRYFFKLYALDIKLKLNLGATKEKVESLMTNHILDQAELVGLYK